MEGDDSLGHTMDIVVEMEHPAIGEYLRLTPLLAALGYTNEQVDDLRSRGVVGG
jgi:hypothetical protein